MLQSFRRPRDGVSGISPVNREIIEAKLESLARCVKRLEEKLPDTASKLHGDYDRQDILAVNLERVIQVSVDAASHIISDFREPFPAVTRDVFDRLAEHGILDRKVASALASAVSLRNIAVHEYRNLDWTHLHSVLITRIDDFRAFAHAVMKWLDGETPGGGEPPG